MRQKDEEKITRIYRAAMKIINREGFEGSCMSKIAAEADISPATIYLYFENKEDMIKKLFMHLKTGMGDSYLSTETELRPSKGTFRSIWMNHFQYLVANPEEFNFLENFSNSPLIQHIDEQFTIDYCPALENLFDQSKKAGLINPFPNDLVYSLLFAPIAYLVKKKNNTGKTITTSDLIQIFDASWRALEK